MTEHEISIQSLQREIHAQRKQLADLSDNVRDLVSAWNTAKGVVRFVRIVGSVATGLGTLWMLTKLALHWGK